MVLLPFLFWLKRYINIDFWYDEVFTLTNYVFCPLSKTLTDYTFPNNHIFFNLINNIYLKILGIKDIYQLMDNPYLIRLLPLIYTLITLFYLYRIGRLFLSQLTATILLVVFTTTITYYNFAVQVRGFALSIMLLTILLYYLLVFERKPHLLESLFIILTTAFALYTIPSNLYFILGISAWLFFSLLFKKKKVDKRLETRGKRQDGKRSKRKEKGLIDVRVKLLFLLFIGGIISLLLYSPVLRDVMSNRFVQSKGLFYLPTLFQAMPFTFAHFLSGRYLFLPILVFGLIAYLRRKRGERLGLFFLLLLAPFIFSFLRGDRHYLRVFVILTPVFALLLSILTDSILEFPRLKSQQFLIFCGLVIYNYITFAFQIKYVENKLERDIYEGIQSQDLNYNYYQAHYRPRDLLREFKRIYEVRPLPVFLGEYDRAALPVYLEKFNIPWERFPSSEMFGEVIAKGGSYVITAFPNKFLRMVLGAGFDCRRINTKLDFHNIFEVRKR